MDEFERIAYCKYYIGNAHKIFNAYAFNSENKLELGESVDRGSVYELCLFIHRNKRHNNIIFIEAVDMNSEAQQETASSVYFKKLLELKSDLWDFSLEEVDGINLSEDFKYTAEESKFYRLEFMNESQKIITQL